MVPSVEVEVEVWLVKMDLGSNMGMVALLLRVEHVEMVVIPMVL